MKLKKRYLFEVASLAAVLTLNVSLFANIYKKANEVNAYTASSLPTTINLNDCTDSEIRTYYAGLNSLSSSERKGTNLLKNLKPILSNGQQYFSYENGESIWKFYEITDRDWVKSPASAISGYNPTTNIINGYTYRSSDPYLHALYINRDVDNQTKAWADHSQNNWGINREHIWAKSHGFQAEGAGGARGDPMHLWAANGHVNNIHSNYFFAFVDKTKSYTNTGNTYSYTNNNYRGFSKNGGNYTVFEPQDCDKGDIARSIFYMVARYNNYAGATTGFSTDNPNLVLANSLSENSRTGTSTATDPYAMGLLSDLLAWNKLDPVDDYEIHRNNLLYRNFTKNRNPFIDFPSWADAIWGTADLDGKNYNSTINSVANPATDTINSGASTAVFGISRSSVNLQVGGTAEICGMNAEGNITWSVGNSNVATLSKTTSTNDEYITITAAGNGTTTVTATNGGKSETCTVTVQQQVVNNYGTLEHPLTITEAKELIDNFGGSFTQEKMYVKGVVTTNSEYKSAYDNYDNIWLSEDGSSSNTFDLYRTKLDSSITEDFTAADSMVGREVVAYGYGQKYKTSYELAPNSGDSPFVMKISSNDPLEKTPKELIEEMDTVSTLSYRYTKETTEGGATDTLVRSTTGITTTDYDEWTYESQDSGISYNGQSAGGNNSIQIRSKNSNSGIVVDANPNNLGASSVTVAWNSNTQTGNTLEVYGKNTAYTAPTDLYGNNDKGTKIGTIVKGTSTSLVIEDDYKYIGLRSNNGALYLESIEIQWGGASVTTYDYTDTCIRFGGNLTKELWDDLDTEDHIIEGFGVMIAEYDVLDGEDIKDFYESAAPVEDNPDVGEELVKYFIPISQMDEIIGSTEDNYFWNLRYSVTDLKQEYTAAAYIKTTEGYVFFKQATYSAKTLADDYIKNRGYSATIADGSLANLANLK